MITVNMLVTIIPFLLATQLTPEHPREKYQWQYGGEMTFDVLVNFSRSDIDRGRRIYCSTISNELKCRVKDAETLSCYFLTPIITFSTINDSSTTCEWSSNFVPLNDHFFFDQDPFEIRFNSRGIENLVVKRTITRWKLDVTKAIVSQLHIGFELKEGQSSFQTAENSNIGHCEVNSRVLVSGGYYENEKYAHANLQLVLLDSNELRYRDILNQGGQIIIEKIRHSKKCQRRPIYFFGIPISHRDDRERGTFMDMILDQNNEMRKELEKRINLVNACFISVSSNTRMIISKKGFSSETVSEGLPIIMGGLRNGPSRQKISVILKSVDPARNVPPMISHPASTSIHTYSSFDHYTRRMLRRSIRFDKFR